jgi:hypothetical protein
VIMRSSVCDTFVNNAEPAQYLTLDERATRAKPADRVKMGSRSGAHERTRIPCEHGSNMDTRARSLHNEIDPLPISTTALTEYLALVQSQLWNSDSGRLG